MVRSVTIKFSPRQLMERAIEVMKQSINEPRTDKKTSPLVGAVLEKPEGTVDTAFHGELRHGEHPHRAGVCGEAEEFLGAAVLGAGLLGIDSVEGRSPQCADTARNKRRRANAWISWRCCRFDRLRATMPPPTGFACRRQTATSRRSRRCEELALDPYPTQRI